MRRRSVPHRLVRQEQGRLVDQGAHTPGTTSAGVTRRYGSGGGSGAVSPPIAVPLVDAGALGSAGEVVSPKPSGTMVCRAPHRRSMPEPDFTCLGRTGDLRRGRRAVAN